MLLIKLNTCIRMNKFFLFFVQIKITTVIKYSSMLNYVVVAGFTVKRLAFIGTTAGICFFLSERESEQK